MVAVYLTVTHGNYYAAQDVSVTVVIILAAVTAAATNASLSLLFPFVCLAGCVSQLKYK